MFTTARTCAHSSDRADQITTSASVAFVATNYRNSRSFALDSDTFSFEDNRINRNGRERLYELIASVSLLVEKSFAPGRADVRTGTARFFVGRHRRVSTAYSPVHGRDPDLFAEN